MTYSRVHRWVFAVTGTILLAVTVVAAGQGTSAGADSGEPPGGLPGVTVPTLSWTSCGTDSQCAIAQVPRDYRHPNAGTIPLYLKRHPATDPAHRIGSLFVNPGGPGGSGAGFVSAVVGKLPPQVASRFDVVGFDPRGVAKSGQVVCQTAEETQQTWADVPARWQPGAFERGQRYAAQFDAACQTRSDTMLPYIGTEYVARDIDLLRAAVGDEKLNYFGVSFGTMIGTVYANLFPTRIRAMSLDGAYDPETYANNPYQYDYGQYVALEKALDRFLDWCGHDQKCGFGGDQTPVAAYDALVAALDDHPVRDADGKVIANGATLTYNVMFQLNNGRPAWPRLGAQLQQAAVHRTGDLLQSVGSAADFFAANVSVECADRIYPSSKAMLRSHLASEAKVAPRMGPVAAWGPPGYDHSHANACQQWPAKQDSRYAGPWHAPGSPPILVVGTTGDPDTPYQDAVALAHDLDNGHLLTFVGEGHSGFGRSRCVRSAEAAYLIDLTVPLSSAQCDDDPPPS